MSGRISIDKLRIDLSRARDGIHDRDAKRMIERVIMCCRQNGWDHPYGDDRIITPNEMPEPAVAAWSSNEARDAFLTGLATYEAPDESDEKDVVWKYPDSLAFQFASASLLASKFIISEKDDGIFQLYRIDDWSLFTTVPVLGNDRDVARAIARSVVTDLEKDGVAVTSRRVGAMTSAFFAKAELQPPPRLLGQPDDTDWCLHRRTVLADPTMPFPNIEKFLCRLSDAKAFAAWIYGVASGENRGRQAIWLHDPAGRGGKSKIISSLAEALFGSRIYTSFFPSGNDGSTHLSAHYAGKKLCVIGDCKNSYILQTGSLKELTGDDKSLVNPKYQQPYSTRFECRVIILGNVPPFILRAKHSTSRILYITVETLTLDDADIDVDYGQKCIRELPGFLAWGEQCYRELCSNHYAIEVNDRVREDTALRIAEGETQFSVQFDDNFIVDPEGQISHKDFARVCNALKLNVHMSNDFREWIKALFQLEQETTGQRRDGWTMSGIRLKTPADRRSRTTDDEMGGPC